MKDKISIEQALEILIDIIHDNELAAICMIVDKDGKCATHLCHNIPPEAVILLCKNVQKYSENKAIEAQRKIADANIRDFSDN